MSHSSWCKNSTVWINSLRPLCKFLYSLLLFGVWLMLSIVRVWALSQNCLVYGSACSSSLESCGLKSSLWPNGEVENRLIKTTSRWAPHWLCWLSWVQGAWQSLSVVGIIFSPNPQRTMEPIYAWLRYFVPEMHKLKLLGVRIRLREYGMVLYAFHHLEHSEHGMHPYFLFAHLLIMAL